MRTPHKCPVCNGSTVVPLGFYHRSFELEFTEKCKTCKDGIIWDDEEEKKEIKEEVKKDVNFWINPSLVDELNKKNMWQHPYFINDKAERNSCQYNKEVNE